MLHDESGLTVSERVEFKKDMTIFLKFMLITMRNEFLIATFLGSSTIRKKHCEAFT